MTPIMEDIKTKFKKIIAYSQGLDKENVNVDKLFEQWLEAKRDIIEAWGGELICEYSTPVDFQLSEKEKYKRLDAFVCHIADVYDNGSLADFIYSRRSDFFDNHLSEDYKISDDKIIPKGTKMIRAFKYFEDDKRVLEDLQNQASMIIQEDKITGTFCLSVHPLDFLTTSENTYHWRSCHALDGEYRSGNLSYMLDKSTIICYLKGSEEAQLPDFPDGIKWNNKKWRMLVFLSDNWDAMFAGRQYPFASPTALELVKNKLLSLFNKDSHYWSNWHNDKLDVFPRNVPVRSHWDEDLDREYISMRGKIYDLYNMIEEPINPLHFNDLTRSSCYTPSYCWHRSSPPYKDIHFTIGNNVKCVCCNKKNIPIPSVMVCADCDAEYGQGENELFTYCACCQRRVLRDDTVWVCGLEGYVCDDCKRQETSICENCGERWYTCDITYQRETETYVCPNCSRGQIRPPLFSSSWLNDLSF